MKLYLLALASVLTCASTGKWVKTDGSVIEVPCPEAYTDSRQRLPGGCTNLKPGVWLSVDRYRSMEVELAGLKAKLESRDEEIRTLSTRVSELESNLLICTAVPECPVCPDHSIKHHTTGAVIGTVITLGGCALWNLSQ